MNILQNTLLEQNQRKELKKEGYELHFKQNTSKDKLHVCYDEKSIFHIILKKYENHFYVKVKSNPHLGNDIPYLSHFEKTFPFVFPLLIGFAKENGLSFLQFSIASFSNLFKNQAEVIRYLQMFKCFVLDDMSIQFLCEQQIVFVNGSSCFFLIDQNVFPKEFKNMSVMEEGFTELKNQGFVFSWRPETRFQYRLYCADYIKKYNVKFEDNVPCLYEDDEFQLKVNSPSDITNHFKIIVEQMSKQRKLESLFSDFVPSFLEKRYSYISRKGISQLFRTLNAKYTYHELAYYFQNKTNENEKTYTVHGKFFFERILNHFVFIYINDKEHIDICVSKEELMEHVLSFSKQEFQVAIDNL